MIAEQRYRLLQNRLRDHLVSPSLDHELIPIIDCSFYRTKESCRLMQSPSSNWNLEHDIQSTETGFRCIRNHLHRLRCEVSSRLMQQNLTGWQLIRAFEEIPNVLETASMNHLNMSDDKFIEQLVQLTRDRISEPLYRCTSVSNESPRRSSSVSDHQRPSPIVPPAPSRPSPSPVATEVHPALKSERKSISSLPQSPPIAEPSPRHSLEEGPPFSMGYQWKGEDN